MTPAALVVTAPWRRPLGTAAMLSLALAALAGCGSSEAPKAAVVRPALVQAAEPAGGDGINLLSGEVRARHEADLAFRIPGKVVARLVDAGVTVKAGQVLARLDPADVQQAAAAVHAQVAAANADFVNARAELERYTALFQRKFISQTVLDQHQTAFDAAKARLDQAQATQAQAKNQVAYASLQADRDGVITQVNVEPGQVVTAGQGVMRLAGPDEPEVLVNVPESYIGSVLAQRAQPVGVLLWASPGKRYVGRIREIAGAADPVTRTFAMRVSLQHPDQDVHLGATASVRLAGASTAANANQTAVSPTRVPLTAVAKGNDGTVVWVLDASHNTVSPRKVTVARYGDNDALLSDGLAPGEQVVVAGVHKLQPGQVVNPVAAGRGA